MRETTYTFDRWTGRGEFESSPRAAEPHGERGERYLKALSACFRRTHSTGYGIWRLSRQTRQWLIFPRGFPLDTSLGLGGKEGS